MNGLHSLFFIFWDRSYLHTLIIYYIYICNYLFAHCGALRAFLRPNLRLSFILGSRFKKPNCFNDFLSSGLIFKITREMPCRSASACELIPPPESFAETL